MVSPVELIARTVGLQHAKPEILHLGTARRRSSGRSHRAFVQVPHVP
jgi:hypothetical protein